MRAWGFWLDDLNWAALRLREAADALDTIIAANPGASIEMGGEVGRLARENRALAQLIAEASRKHGQATKR